LMNAVSSCQPPLADFPATTPQNEAVKSGEKQSGVTQGTKSDFSPSQQRVFRLWGQALNAKPELNADTDEILYAWIKENLTDESEDLPGEETFLRYLREVRSALGLQKNRRRKGRSGR